MDLAAADGEESGAGEGEGLIVGDGESAGDGEGSICGNLSRGVGSKNQGR